MPIVVQKYGGSSVADVDKLEAVAEKVVATRATGAEVVVVVSAMGGTTDQLLALAHAVDPTPPRRELDMLVSTGERVSMALLSMAIQKRGVPAISFTGSQSGIITNDRHFDAKVIEVRPYRIEDELARGRVVIVAGYQGMSYKREITTLGRGGSDTTAIALAAALGAERAEIYSDVDGVYSADPRRVPDAAHLPELTYDEMEAMSQAGARVLHAKAVAYARAHRIAIHARSTFASGPRETVVRDGGGAARRPAVVGRRGLAEVTFAGPEDLRAALLALAEAGHEDLTVSDGALLLATEDGGAGREALSTHGGRIREGLAQVTVVGAGASLAAILGAGAAATWGLSVGPGRVALRCTEADVDALVCAIHAALG